MKVPIKNVYHLFCYAWRFLPEELAIDIGDEPGPDVINLCAHVITTGLDRLLRRGLDRGYMPQVEEMSRLRGRIDISGTVRRLLNRQCRALCSFDDLSPDVLHNRILLTTIKSLSSEPTLTSAIRKRLRESERRLAGISETQLSSALFRRVQLYRKGKSTARALPQRWTTGGKRFLEQEADQAR